MQARSRKKYEAVLKACTQVLTQHGYRGATMMELSSTGSRLGFAVGSVVVITGAVAIMWSPPPVRAGAGEGEMRN